MAQDDRILENKVCACKLHSIRATTRTAHPSLLPVVHITSADARLADFNADSIWSLRRGNGTVFECDVLDGAQDERGVHFLSCC